MKISKKIITLVLSVLLAFCCFAACEGARVPDGAKPDDNPNPPIGGVEGGDNPDTEIGSTPSAEAEFVSIHAGGSGAVSPTQSFTLPLNHALAQENYLAIELDTDVAVRGEIVYIDTVKSGAAHERTEEFWTLAGTGQSLRQILDFYNRYNATSLVRVTFTAVSDAGTVTVSDVSLAEHPFDFSKVDVRKQLDEKPFQVYLTGEQLKVGCSVQSGGAINFLSSTAAKASVVGENLYVGTQGEQKADFVRVAVEKDVNLINTADNGRLVQQSYYGVRSGADGYEGAIYGGNDWPYNPVQGGSYANGCSQIVDLQVAETGIYVKTRPLDWAKGFSVTNAYMENFYSIEKSESGIEYVRIQNRFTDFSGYNHNNVRHQELPAFYGIAPLGTAVYYQGGAPYTDGELTTASSLGFWAGNPAENKLRCDESWISWVNEDNWGIGLYVPDVTSVLAGRNAYTVKHSVLGNNAYLAGATTYAAPLSTFSLYSGTAFSYDYYLTVGDVAQNRALFADLHASGAANPYLRDNGVAAW